MELSDIDQRVKDIIIDISKLGNIIPSHLVDPLFTVHNTLYPDNKEFNKGCSSCRSRVFSNVLKYYNQNILNN